MEIIQEGNVLKVVSIRALVSVSMEYLFVERSSGVHDRGDNWSLGHRVVGSVLFGCELKRLQRL